MIFQQARRGDAQIVKAFPLLYALYAVLLLITVCAQSPPEVHVLMLCEDENYFSVDRVLKGVAERYPKP
jgi:hypothetical protein